MARTELAVRAVSTQTESSEPDMTMGNTKKDASVFYQRNKGNIYLYGRSKVQKVTSELLPGYQCANKLSRLLRKLVGLAKISVFLRLL